MPNLHNAINIWEIVFDTVLIALFMSSPLGTAKATVVIVILLHCSPKDVILKAKKILGPL